MFMLVETEYTVDLEDIHAIDLTTINEMKTPLNKPTTSFFYDPWILKDEYKNTIWEKILSTLPFDIGEARVISLESKECYTKHTDVDDRYHLNIFGDEGYLIDLSAQEIFKTECDGIWYKMDAGKFHTAANFGEYRRIQLVVRKLLDPVVLQQPVGIEISPGGSNPRYTFDNTLSPWINKMCKAHKIANLVRTEHGIELDLENTVLEEFENFLPKEFRITIRR